MRPWWVLALGLTACGGISERSGRDSTPGGAGGASTSVAQLPPASSSPPTASPPMPSPPRPSTPPPSACPQLSLNVDWTVISGCLESGTGGPYDITALRCAFPAQLTNPDYGPFVACCPLEEPYGCPNGTPQSCFATAAEAQAACGDQNCQECSAWR